jgi:hypothetical protein
VDRQPGLRKEIALRPRATADRRLEAGDVWGTCEPLQIPACIWLLPEEALVFLLGKSILRDGPAIRNSLAAIRSHLGIAFCRCQWILQPGLKPILGAAGTRSTRNNLPRIGRGLIARGRDAAAVAIATTFGPNTLENLRVWTDEVEGFDEGFDAASVARTNHPSTTGS